MYTLQIYFDAQRSNCEQAFLLNSELTIVHGIYLCLRQYCEGDTKLFNKISKELGDIEVTKNSQFDLLDGSDEIYLTVGEINCHENIL
jgi:hypothetical protein